MRIVSTTRERTSFIGRITERALLANDLERGCELVTLTGPSGIGKTRLAFQVGLESVGRFESGGGVWVCSLSACRGAADVEAAVARMLGIPERHGEELARAIAHRGRLLLIVDNLDSVAAETGEVIRRWLDRSPELQILTTSIVPVDLPEAVRYELGPMETQDAVALYLERAHRASAGSIQDSDRPTVETLVGRLDRIPLAIELAAARVRVFPPETLLSRFEDRFDLLRSGKAGRHGSLIEALTLTWEFLSPREQDFLTRASVFEGGLSYDAALAVVGKGGDELEAIELLDGLRSKALVQTDSAGKKHRFVLIECVRDFASRELRSKGQEAEAYHKHVELILGQGEEHAARCDGPEASESLEWLKAERENLVAILLRNHPKERDPLVAARAGLILSRLVELDGHPPAGTRLLELTLQAARDSGEEGLVVKAIHRLCTAIIRYGREDEAKVLLEEGLKICRSRKNAADEARLLAVEGRIHVRLGTLDRATATLKHAIELAKGEGLPLLEAAANMDLGAACHYRHEMEEAEAYMLAAQALLRGGHSPRLESYSQMALAVMRAQRGHLHEARVSFEEALASGRRLGDRGFEATVVMNLGGLELLAGRLDEAEAHSRAALYIQRQVGNRRGEGIVLGNLGTIALERGQTDAAERMLQESVGLLEEQGERRVAAILTLFLAVAEARLGRITQARRDLADADEYLREANDEATAMIAELVAGAVDLAEAAVQGDGARDRAIEGVRELLGRFRSSAAAKSAGIAEAIRLLEQDLARHEAREASPPPPPPALSPTLEVGPGAAWFKLAGKEHVDLRRRVSLRLMLQALVELRLSSPGQVMDAHQLFTTGWPGVDIDPEQATRRLYVGVWTLRGLGLSGVLLYRDDGYLLDPEVPIEVREERDRPV